MIIIKLSHGSQTYYNHMESQCLEDVTNFRKMKNHSIFTFLVQCAIYIFGTNIFQH